MRDLSGPVATLAALGAAAVAALGAFALVRGEAHGLSDASELLAVLGAAPLIFGIVAFVDPKPRAWLRGLGTRAPLVVAGVIAACLFLEQEAASRTVDAYGIVVTFAGAWAVAGVLNECSRRTPTLGPADGLALVALWVPLCSRMFRGLGPLAGELDYAWWSLAVSFVALAGWAALRDIPSVGFRPPTSRDLAVGLVAVVALASVLIPAGVASGFLKTPHPPKHDAAKIALELVGTLVLIALPEEIIFRGVLDGGLRAMLGRPGLSIIISSALFGLSHWPRADKLDEKVAYCIFATIAGAIYALAYRKSNGLPAAILCHTLVDVTWVECLHK